MLSAGHYFLPKPTMLYRIKLQYSFTVDATSHLEAYLKGVQAILAFPEGQIAKVEDASIEWPKRPLWKRLLLGR